MKIAALILYFAVSVTGVSAFAQANTSLSNLSSTAVNADILPGTTDSIYLGNASHRYLGITGSCGNFGSEVKIGDCTTDGGIIARSIIGTSGNSFLKFAETGDFRIQLVAEYSLLVKSGESSDMQIESGGNITLKTGPDATRQINVGGHVSFKDMPVPTWVAATNMGTDGIVQTLGGINNDVAGRFQIYTSGNRIAPGPQATLTFQNAYNGAPICVITPENSAAALDEVSVYVVVQSESLAIYFADAGAPNTNYNYSYHCVGIE